MIVLADDFSNGSHAPLGFMKELLRIDIEDGKYTLIQQDDGKFFCLRYGEPWITSIEIGSKMILAMAYELEALRKEHAH